MGQFKISMIFIIVFILSFLVGSCSEEKPQNHDVSNDVIDILPDSLSGCDESSMECLLADTLTYYCVPLSEFLCAQAVDCGCNEISGWPGEAGCLEYEQEKCLIMVEGFSDIMEFEPLAIIQEVASECIAAIEHSTGHCDLPPDGRLTGACLPMLSSRKELGSSCSFPVCADGKGFCDPSQNICKAIPEIDEPCMGICKHPLICTEEKEKCKEPKSAEKSCERDLECSVPLECLNGVCTTLLLAGDACSVSQECSTGLGCYEGECLLPPPVCTSQDDDCGNQGRCLASSQKICQPIAGIGEECESQRECGNTMWCDQGGSGLCEEMPEEGEVCGSGVYCADDAACSMESNTCEAIPNEGEHCSLGVLGPHICAEGLGCIEMLCAAIPLEGEPCAFQNLCAGDLGCDFREQGSICTVPSGLGGDCTNDTMCSEGFCDFSTLRCALYELDGGACVDGNECAPGYSCVPEGSSIVCRETPNEGESCLFDCAQGLMCSQSDQEGRCSPPICSIMM